MQMRTLNRTQAQATNTRARPKHKAPAHQRRAARRRRREVAEHRLRRRPVAVLRQRQRDARARLLAALAPRAGERVVLVELSGFGGVLNLMVIVLMECV